MKRSTQWLRKHLPFFVDLFESLVSEDYLYDKNLREVDEVSNVCSNGCYWRWHVMLSISLSKVRFDRGLAHTFECDECKQRRTGHFSYVDRKLYRSTHPGSITTTLTNLTLKRN